MNKRTNWIVGISDGKAHEYKIGNVTFTVFSEFEPMKSENTIKSRFEKSSINFERDTLQIAHTVVKVNKTVCKDKTKNASSFRSFPLIPEIKELLIKEKARQKINRKEFRKEYIESPYIFVWDNGNPYSTDYVSRHFGIVLKNCNLPHIRFHDLRHSCASILLSRGFTLKDVQEWLGHADIGVTANIYGHLDIERKKNIANTMANMFS